MPDMTRIDQFRKMANDDPDNELGHFSLGKAYLDSGMPAEAVTSLDRAIELNGGMTKAYQLAATAFLKLGQTSDAIDRLTRGAAIADERGDLMPRDEMARMLREQNAPVPAFKKASAPQQVAGEGEVLCHRCNRVGKRLAKPPFNNPQGKLIYEKICIDCWRQWIGMGTKVINELRLPLNDPQAQKIYDQHMMEFLNLTGE